MKTRNCMFLSLVEGKDKKGKKNRIVRKCHTDKRKLWRWETKEKKKIKVLPENSNYVKTKITQTVMCKDSFIQTLY